MPKLQLGVGSFDTRYGFAHFDAIVDAAGGGTHTDIQSAVDESKLSILVLDGNYTLTADVELDTSGQSLTGESRGGVVVTCDGFTFNYTSGAIMRDLTLKNGSDTTNGVINMKTNGSGITRNIAFSNNKRNIVLSGTNITNVNIESCNFATWNGASGEAYILRPEGSSGSPSNLKIVDNNFDSGPGIRIDASMSTAIIQGNFNTQRELASEPHFYLEDMSDTIVTNNVLFYTGAFDASDGGIEVATNCSRIVISNNVIRSGSKDIPQGVTLGSDQCNVISNIIVGPDFGIKCRSSSNIINGNILASGDSDGILIDGDFDNNIVIGNQIKSYTGVGVNISSSSADNTILTNNNLSGNTGGAFTDSGTTTQIGLNITS